MPCRACADLDNDITDAISNIDDGITLITTPVQYIPFPVGAGSFSFIDFSIIPVDRNVLNAKVHRVSELGRGVHRLRRKPCRSIANSRWHSYAKSVPSAAAVAKNAVLLYGPVRDFTVCLASWRAFGVSWILLST